jgi:hypothetical protein
MSDHRDRAKNEIALQDKRVVETAKALIELYKSAFGDEWKNRFGETIRLRLG